MVTRSGWFVLAGSIVTVLAGRLLGLAELYVLGSIGIAVVVAALVQVRRPPPDLDVERQIQPRRVHLGAASRVELRIANRGGRRTPVLSLLDPVEGTVGARVSIAPLAPGERQAATYRLPTDRRGLVRIGPLEAQVTDAFGLVRRRLPIAGGAALTVLPAIERLGTPGTGHGRDDPLTGLAHPARGLSGDDEFATLRPYVVGDDLRRVHWASTARTGDLLVRQDDPPWQGHLTVVLDARSDRIDQDRFEVAVSAAASLISAVARRGDRARLILSDGTDSGLVDARAAHDTLLEHLALIERHEPGELPDPAPDGRSRTGGLVVVTGSPSAEDLARVSAQRTRFASVLLVVVGSRPAGGAPLPGAASGVDLVVVEEGQGFGAAWAAARRSRAGRT